MLIFYLPFIFIVFLGGWNILQKRRILCASSITFLYLFLVFAGMPFLYLYPRSGTSFCNVSALVYLSFIYILQMIPLFYMKEPFQGGVPNYDLRSLKRLNTLLIVLCVPTALYFFCNLQTLLSFINGGGEREILRADMDMSIRGNFIMTYIVTTMTFSRASLFMSVFSFLFTKESKWRCFLLFLGGMGGVLRSLSWLARSVLFEQIVFILVVVGVFYPYLTPKTVQRLKRVGITVLGILLLPFLAITLTRFTSDFLYQTFAYFCTGPYFFGVLYTALCSSNEIPLFRGAFLTPLYVQIFNQLTGSEAPKYDPNWKVDYLYIFRELCESWPGEFSTVVGNFLQDWSLTETTFIFVIICIIFSILFSKAKFIS